MAGLVICRGESGVRGWGGGHGRLGVLGANLEGPKGLWWLTAFGQSQCGDPAAPPPQASSHTTVHGEVP